MVTLGHARIVLVVRDDIRVHKLEEYMDNQTATIWVRVGAGRLNSLVVGGIYREHSQLGQQQQAATWLDRKILSKNRDLIR